MLIIILLLLRLTCGFYVPYTTNRFILFANKHSKHKYNNPFLQDIYKPVREEKHEEIRIPNDSIYYNISGFFAQIGPNPKYHSSYKPYSLFDGDGMIHGIFFNKSKITYTNHWVRTKKLKTEMKWKKQMYLSLGELKGVSGLSSIFSSELMKTFKLVPTGYTANTAFMYVKNKLFALHETDTPYVIDLNFSNNTIHTGKHYDIDNICTTTAHPKFDDFRKCMYLYSYNTFFDKGYFCHNVFDYDFHLKENRTINLLNNGIIHDIGQTRNKLIIPDLPLKMDFNRMFHDMLPIYFDKNGTSRFGVLDKDNGNIRWYDFRENFFIFHFSECYETRDHIYIHACLLDDLNFESFIDNEKFDLFSGTQICQIVLDKRNSRYKIIKNKYIDDYLNKTSLVTEFPISSILNGSNVYCTLIGSNVGQIKGYVKLNLNSFEDSVPNYFILDNRYGTSEPQPVVIDDKEFLLTYTYDKDRKYYLTLIDFDNKILHDIAFPDDIRIPVGFHSIYLST